MRFFFGLRTGDQSLDRLTLDKAHRQHRRAGQVAVHLRQQHRRIAGNQFAILPDLLSFADIVGFLLQLPPGLSDKRRNRYGRRDEPRQGQQRNDVVEVAVDARGDAGILHLDRQIATLPRPGAMHLPDGGGGYGRHVEIFEPIPPSRPPLLCQLLFELPAGHRRCVSLQPRQDR